MSNSLGIPGDNFKLPTFQAELREICVRDIVVIGQIVHVAALVRKPLDYEPLLLSTLDKGQG